MNRLFDAAEFLPFTSPLFSELQVSKQAFGPQGLNYGNTYQHVRPLDFEEIQSDLQDISPLPLGFLLPYFD